jgi:toxin CptA
MVDLVALESRLENWARAQRSSGYQGGRAASAEGAFRGGRRELRPAPQPVDAGDAHLVNEAWKRLMPLDKDVLMLHYVWRAHSSFICRRLKIRQGRGREHAWDFALHHAHQAIDDKLRKVMEIANPVRAAYTLAKLMTETVD